MEVSNKRILCIDDDNDTCELLKVVLERYGYQVEATQTVAGSRAMIPQGHFDLYILDERLPDGHGVEVCRRIRSFDPNTPIVFFSGASREIDRQLAKAAGAQAYITKPSDLEDLVQAIRRLIDTPAGASGSERLNSPTEQTAK